MQFSLDVLERLKLCSLLPTEGNIVTLRMVHTLANKLGLSAEEHTKYEVKILDPVKGLVQWNELGAIPVDIELADAEVELIRKQLKDLDSKNKLTPDLISIWEKLNP
jgi:hypothetical protein